MGLMRTSRRQSGSVFTVLLAGIAIAGALSIVMYQTISGPMSSMVRVTNNSAVRTQLQTVSNIVLGDAINQTSSGDCDSDGSVEPRGWRTGTYGPTGGGLVPTTIGIPVKDPWGTDYGYCVWDVGSFNDPGVDHGCGVVTNRLKGTDDPTGSIRGGSNVSKTVIAVISAGPNRQFQTTCSAFTADATDVITPGGDDIIQRYTYSEAAAASATASLWKLKPADSTKAVINKDLAVGPTATPTFTVSSSSGLLSASAVTTTGKVIANGGVTLGNAVADTDCTVATTGLTRYNATSKHIESCNGATWDAAGGGALSALTAATNINTIGSANFAQVWNWDTLTTETALSLATPSMTTGSLLTIANTNATATGPALNVSTANLSGLALKSNGKAKITGILNVNDRVSFTGIAGDAPLGLGNNGGTLTFINQTGAPLSSTITSNTITVKAAGTATCNAGCIGISHNGSAFVPGPVGGFVPGDTIAIRLTSSGSYGTAATASVTVGNVLSDTWSVTTVPPAAAFSFTDQSGVNLASTITSNTVTLTGGFSNLTATCNAGCTAMNVNGGGWVAGPVAGLNSGATIAIRQTSSASFNTPTTATVSVGPTTSGVWTVTTFPPPNAFNFTAQTGVARSTTITSNTVTLGGGFSNLTATCNAGCTGISINGAAFTAGPVTGVNSGDTIAIRQMSSASYNTATTASVSVGPTTSSAWSVTTTPTATAFNFTDQTNVAVGSVAQSAAVTLAGGFTNLTASCNAGCTGISINGAAFTAGPISGVNSGDNIRIQQTASASYGTPTTATVTVGGTTSGTWTVTTVPTASAFSFTNRIGIARSTVVQSNAVTLSGGFTNYTATCNAGCTGISRNGGGFVAGPVSGFNSGDTIAIQQTSSPSNGTVTTATVTIGGTTSGTWSVTTLVTDVQTFTSSGTWIKPSGATSTTIQCWAGGGGGGSGGASGGACGGGGGGGGGGGNSSTTVASSSLAASVAVTVGGGGNGGACCDTLQPGSAGGTSSFGGTLSIGGGNGGGAGTNPACNAGVGGAAGSGGGNGSTGQNGPGGFWGGVGGTGGSSITGGGGGGAGGGSGSCVNCPAAINGTSAGANSGAGGGGGGGGGNGYGAGGGNGGSGKCIITTN